MHCGRDLLPGYSGKERLLFGAIGIGLLAAALFVTLGLKVLGLDADLGGGFRIASIVAFLLFGGIGIKVLFGSISPTPISARLEKQVDLYIQGGDKFIPCATKALVQNLLTTPGPTSAEQTWDKAYGFLDTLDRNERFERQQKLLTKMLLYKAATEKLSASRNNMESTAKDFHIRLDKISKRLPNVPELLNHWADATARLANLNQGARDEALKTVSTPPKTQDGSGE